MNLAERLAGIRPNRLGMRCSIHTLLQSMDVADAAALQAALDVPPGDRNRLFASQLCEVLTDMGFEVHRSALERHRRRDCRCFSSGNPE